MLHVYVCVIIGVQIVATFLKPISLLNSSDLLCTVALNAELLVSKRPSSISTSATHLYSPPWLASRGSKVNITTPGAGVDTVMLSSLSMTAPLEFVHMMVGVDLSGCSKVAVQVSVYMCPAVEVPVLSMSTTGAAGTSRGRDSQLAAHTGRVDITHLQHPVI